MNSDSRTSVHSSIIHNSQQVKTIQISIDGWMDAQNVVSPNDGILFSLKKKWDSDTGYNMDEPRRQDNKWNKLDTRGQVLYSTYEVPRISTFMETGGRRVAAKGWMEWENAVTVWSGQCCIFQMFQVVHFMLCVFMWVKIKNKIFERWGKRKKA